MYHHLIIVLLMVFVRVNQVWTEGEKVQTDYWWSWLSTLVDTLGPRGLRSSVQSVWPANPAITWPFTVECVCIVQDQDRQSVQNRQTIILKSGKKPRSYVSVVLMVVFVVEIYSWSLGGEQFVSRPGTLYNPGLWPTVTFSPFKCLRHCQVK